MRGRLETMSSTTSSIVNSLWTAGDEMKKTAYIAFALLGVIWGSNFIFMKWAGEEISPSQIVLLRVAFGFLPIFLFALAKRALRWEHVLGRTSAG